eukprot:6130523-Amphidinium_carterae.1
MCIHTMCHHRFTTFASRMNVYAPTLVKVGAAYRDSTSCHVPTPVFHSIRGFAECPVVSFSHTIPRSQSRGLSIPWSCWAKRIGINIMCHIPLYPALHPSSHTV